MPRLHYKTEYCNPEGHSSVTAIYLYIGKVLHLLDVCYSCWGSDQTVIVYMTVIFLKTSNDGTMTSVDFFQTFMKHYIGTLVTEPYTAG